MTHVKALQAGHSSQGTSEPITPVIQVTTCTVLGNISPHSDRVICMCVWLAHHH